MPSTACGSCTAPVPDGFLCSGCTRDLAGLLLLAASIAPDLDDAVARLLKRGSGGRRSETEAPLPVDLNASQVHHDLYLLLVRCAGWLITEGEPADGLDVAPMARWIAVRLNRLRQHARAAAAHREIRAAVQRALAVIDRKPDRAPAGTCDGCGTQLLAELGADEVRCQCGAVTLALQDKRRERAAAADVLGTPADISAALARIGIAIPRGTITSWVSRKRITLRPGNVIALSDVLALHAQRHRLACLTCVLDITHQYLGQAERIGPGRPGPFAFPEVTVAGRKTPGRVTSKAQQGFLFAAHKTFAKRWSMAAGETGPHGHPSPASKAAYARLPRRKGARKRA